MAEFEHFLTITEVSKQLDIPSHILRFWEKQFKELKPITGKGNRRYYKPEDVKLIAIIKDLLYKQGYTIRGVKKLLSNKNDNGISGQVKELNQSQNTDLEKAMTLLIQARMILSGTED